MIFNGNKVFDTDGFIISRTQDHTRFVDFGGDISAMRAVIDGLNRAKTLGNPNISIHAHDEVDSWEQAVAVAAAARAGELHTATLTYPPSYDDYQALWQALRASRGLVVVGLHAEAERNFFDGNGKKRMKYASIIW